MADNSTCSPQRQILDDLNALIVRATDPSQHVWMRSVAEQLKTARASLLWHIQQQEYWEREHSIPYYGG